MAKTVKLQSVVELVNTLISNSLPEEKNAREYLSTLISALLIESKNYGGFKYTKLENIADIDKIDQSYRKYFTKDK